MSEIILSHSSIEPLAVSLTFSQATAMLRLGLSTVSVTKSETEAALSGGFGRTISLTTSVTTANLAAPLSAVSVTTSVLQAFVSNRPPQEGTLSLVVDIVPASEGSYVRLWMPRLKVDGVEVEILEAEHDEPIGAVGARLNVAIADLNIRNTLFLGASVEFGFGKKADGAWDEATFRTLFNDGVIESISDSEQGPNRAPQDSCTLAIAAGVNAKLSSSPETDLIIHDPAVITIDPAELEILLDTEGREYVTEIKPIAKLSLKKLFQEIYVVRSGFTAFQTNLSDLLLDRADFGMGRYFQESIASHYGMYEAEVVGVGNDIWILDMTNLMPDGFPSPMELTVDDLQDLQVEQSRTPVDAFRVQYSEKARDWDFVTTRTESKTEPNGETGDPNYYTTTITRGWREYRKFSSPFLVLRDELYREGQRSSGMTPAGTGVFFDSEEAYHYNEQAMLYGRTKRVQQLVPVWSQLLLTVLDEMRETTREKERIDYAVHSFRPSLQYVSRRTIDVTGMLIVDSDNQQLGRDFKMPYAEANRKGNLAEGQTIEEGQPISTVVEKSKPLRNGQVETEIVEVNHVTGERIPHPKDTRPGEIAFNGLSPQQNEVLVFDDENTTRATGRVETFNAGPMNQDEAVALGRRKLKARKLKPRTVRTNVIAFREGFEKGMPATFRNRKDESVGNYLIVGRKLLFSRQGMFMQLTGKQF